MKSTPQKLVPAIQNAAQVLRALSASGRPMSSSMISKETGLNGSSVFNILRTLAYEGLVDFESETKTYRLSMGLLDFVNPLLGLSPVQLIRPLLVQIAEEHQTMIAQWQITEDERILLIDNISATRIVQAQIARGGRLPAFAGAIGRCYCAALGLDRASAEEGYDSVRWQDAPGFNRYWEDVCAAVENGYAFDHGSLFRGLEISATVIRNERNRPCFGLSNITIAGQQSREAQTEVAQRLAEASARIEQTIFGRKPDEPAQQNN